MEMFIRLINFPNSKLYQIFYKPWRFRTRGKDASLSGMGLVKVFSLVWKYSDSTRKRLLPNDRQKFSQRLWCWQLCCHKIQIMWSLVWDINMACKSIYCSRFSLKSSPDPINEFDILRTFSRTETLFEAFAPQFLSFDQYTFFLSQLHDIKKIIRSRISPFRFEISLLQSSCQPAPDLVL